MALCLRVFSVQRKNVSVFLRLGFVGIARILLHSSFQPSGFILSRPTLLSLPGRFCLRHSSQANAERQTVVCGFERLSSGAMQQKTLFTVRFRQHNPHSYFRPSSQEDPSFYPDHAGVARIPLPSSFQPSGPVGPRELESRA